MFTIARLLLKDPNLRELFLPHCESLWICGIDAIARCCRGSLRDSILQFIGSYVSYIFQDKGYSSESFILRFPQIFERLKCELSRTSRSNDSVESSSSSSIISSSHLSIYINLLLLLELVKASDDPGSFSQSFRDDLEIIASSHCNYRMRSKSHEILLLCMGNQGIE